MANYTSKYTGEQIDEAVGKALSASGGGGGVAPAYCGFHLFEKNVSSKVWFLGINTNDEFALKNGYGWQRTTLGGAEHVAIVMIDDDEDPFTLKSGSAIYFDGTPVSTASNGIVNRKPFILLSDVTIQAESY